MKDLDKKVIEKRNLDNNFFNPLIDLNLPHDPSFLLNIKEGYKVFLNYIADQDKRISIYADPDIDGIMATSIMYQWIKNIHSNVKIIHHQRNKGHGVVPSRVNDTDLLIIVDSSSNSISEVKEILSSKKAKDIIIIDHHETNNVMVQNGYLEENDSNGNDVLTPNYEYEAEINQVDNVVLINPHQPNDDYPNKNVSGALLTLKFLEFCENFIDNKYTHKLVDLAAISIISDVMSVTEMENRYYYYKGTSLIQNLGLATLFNVMGLDVVNIKSDDIGFKLNKALNSLLRLQDIRTIFKLILEYKSEDDINLVDKILQAVKQRESVEENIISSITVLNDSKGVIVAQNNYTDIVSVSNNFNGVIASKMADKEHKNIIIVNEQLQGSARAFNNYNFKDYVVESGCADGAGHQGAFGVKINDLKKFSQYIIDHPPTFEIDDEYEFELEFKDLSKKFFMEVEELQHLIGNGFGRIKFLLKDVEIGEVKETSGGNTYYILNGNKSYIRFLDKSIREDKLKQGNICDMYFTMRVNNFFGKDYYECECYNIDVIDDKINDDWGFLDE